jgi:hypothetical protein
MLSKKGFNIDSLHAKEYSQKRLNTDLPGEEGSSSQQQSTDLPNEEGSSQHPLNIDLPNEEQTSQHPPNTDLPGEEQTSQHPPNTDLPGEEQTSQHPPNTDLPGEEESLKLQLSSYKTSSLKESHADSSSNMKKGLPKELCTDNSLDNNESESSQNTIGADLIPPTTTKNKANDNVILTASTNDQVNVNVASQTNAGSQANVSLITEHTSNSDLGIEIQVSQVPEESNLEVYPYACILSDWVFKLIMCNEEYLHIATRILNVFLEADPQNRDDPATGRTAIFKTPCEFTLLPTDQWRESLDGTRTAVDSCFEVVGTRQRIIVEVQRRSIPGLANRTQLYADRAFAQTKKKGEGYDKMGEVKVITIADFSIIPSGVPAHIIHYHMPVNCTEKRVDEMRLDDRLAWEAALKQKQQDNREKGFIDGFNEALRYRCQTSTALQGVSEKSQEEALKEALEAFRKKEAFKESQEVSEETPEESTDRNNN